MVRAQEKTMKRRAFTLALPALPFAERMLASPAWAQGDDWPKNNVRIVCPFTPGGSQDNIARRLAVKLSEALGQTFVVENRTGAGGSIAADIQCCWAISAVMRWCRTSTPGPPTTPSPISRP
jgi:hypothetical protein